MKIYISAFFILISTCIFAQVKNDTIKKETEAEQLEEVKVQSTRTNRTIRNTPTRIEILGAEELDEKGNMEAGAGVKMLLNESTGLQTQQTSATSGNSSIRVQGLDGRYTQILKDGYPNFGNFSSGLSIIQIAPLDLKQVEVIKGPASTLYGAGAIAGAINLISKTPNEKPENTILLNQSHIGQASINIFSSRKIKQFGYTLLVAENFQKSFDVDNDNFSETPKSNTFIFEPKIFYYPNSKTTFMIGNSFTKGNLKGGDMQVIAGNFDANHTYFEQNKSIRNTTILEFDKKLENNNSFKFKQSLSFFDRQINIPNFEFSGLNTNSFSDISILLNKQKHTILSGLNILYDNFKQNNTNTQNSKSFTTGIYIQDTWDISEKIKLENGLRIDNVNYSNQNFSKNQFFVLPRISALFKFNTKLSSRIGGGLGYKTPTIFTEKTETIQYQNILALNNVSAEKSIGATADINFKTQLGDEKFFSINQLFFITQINDPLVLQQNNLGQSFFENASQPVVSKGFETNIKLIIEEDFKIFVGYTFTDAKAKYLQTNQNLLLLPKNILLFTTVYEKEKNFKLGFEGFFTDQQYLENGTKTPTFWTFGFMAQKTLWKHFDFFINFENFTNVKQSNYKRVVNPPNNNPTFDEIWTHTEGFVFNGGVKIKF
ncbi:MAG: TonB-dependent receptor [Flavobacterium sp.]|nr:TonB-dependent receptor [Flavobacterium sp.]